LEIVPPEPARFGGHCHFPDCDTDVRAACDGDIGPDLHTAGEIRWCGSA